MSSDPPSGPPRKSWKSLTLTGIGPLEQAARAAEARAADALHHDQLGLDQLDVGWGQLGQDAVDRLEPGQPTQRQFGQHQVGQNAVVALPMVTLHGTGPPPPAVTPSPPAAATRVRPKVGRYEVLTRLASGGMGGIYLCRHFGDAEYERLFALKLLHRHLRGSDEHVAMFHEEARLGTRLTHPHIVSVVDEGALDGQPYLVMRYVEGCSLAELMKESPDHRPPALIVPLLLDALSGLAYAHALTDANGTLLNLVHCDVSPHNLLIDVNGSCCITDFGVARVKTLGRAGEDVPRRGKPAYMSPEQLAGGAVDCRSDLFSMGVVLYNVLTGQELFLAANVEETLANVLRQPIEPPSQVGLRPPRAFDAVCMKALARRPEDRFQTATEMAQALKQAAHDADLLASRGELAVWIHALFGHELRLRRMSLAESPPNVRLGDSGSASRSGARAALTHDASHTLVLDDVPKSRRKLLIVALVLALGLVLAAALWPEHVLVWFKATSAH